MRQLLRTPRFALRFTPSPLLQADTLQSVAVSLITLTLAVPLFTSTGLMLLQAAPEALRPSLDRARREASVLEGVIEVADEHWWSQSPGCVVGSLVVRTRSDADTQAVLERVRSIYGRFVQDLTVQVEREPDMNAVYSMAPSSSGNYATSAGEGRQAAVVQRGAPAAYVPIPAAAPSSASSAAYSAATQVGSSYSPFGSVGAHGVTSAVAGGGGGHGHSHGGSGGGDHDHAHHGHGGHEDNGDHHGHSHGDGAQQEPESPYLQRFVPVPAAAAAATAALPVAPASGPTGPTRQMVAGQFHAFPPRPTPAVSDASVTSVPVYSASPSPGVNSHSHGHGHGSSGHHHEEEGEEEEVNHGHSHSHGHSDHDEGHGHSHGGADAGEGESSNHHGHSHSHHGHGDDDHHGHSHAEGAHGDDGHHGHSHDDHEGHGHSHI